MADYNKISITTTIVRWPFTLSIFTVIRYYGTNQINNLAAKYHDIRFWCTRKAAWNNL